MEKAKITVLGETETEIEVQFNPKEYELKFSNTYEDKNIVGTNQVATQFTHVEPIALQVSLFMDDSARITLEGYQEAKDISIRVKKMIDLIYVDATLHRPPHIKFQWGPLNFIGIVTAVASKYIKFDKEGKPTRATVELNIREIMDTEANAKQTPFESPDRTKCRMISAGNSLWNIAYEEYGRMEDWRIIASENELFDPLDIKPGRMLRVPALS